MSVGALAYLHGPTAVFGVYVFPLCYALLFLFFACPSYFGDRRRFLGRCCGSNDRVFPLLHRLRSRALRRGLFAELLAGVRFIMVRCASPSCDHFGGGHRRVGSRRAAGLHHACAGLGVPLCNLVSEVFSAEVAGFWDQVSVWLKKSSATVRPLFERIRLRARNVP